MAHQFCPVHTDESVPGVNLPDGSVSYTCDRSKDHPNDGPWSWLYVPAPPDTAGATGMAEELRLELELPAALAALGTGWFEYGLVERAYAEHQPDGFERMVQRWGHTAIEKKQYTVSAYIARTLGQLSRDGAVAYRPAPGTGRWRYNDPISWWSLDPEAPWEERTSWVSVVGDHDQSAQDDDEVCRTYVPGAMGD